MNIKNSIVFSAVIYIPSHRQQQTLKILLNDCEYVIQFFCPAVCIPFDMFSGAWRIVADYSTNTQWPGIISPCPLYLRKVLSVLESDRRPTGDGVVFRLVLKKSFIRARIMIYNAISFIIYTKKMQSLLIRAVLVALNKPGTYTVIIQISKWTKRDSTGR